MRILFALVVILGSFGVAHAQRERIVGRPCEGCEAVFTGLPAIIDTEGRMVPPNEPGAPMVLEGIVRDAAGQPVAGVIVYGYRR